MRFKTFLYTVEKYSSFVYRKVYFGVQNLKDCTVIKIQQRVGSKGTCPVCLMRCSTYDTVREPRLFLIVSVYFPYKTRHACGHPVKNALP